MQRAIKPKDTFALRKIGMLCRFLLYAVSLLLLIHAFVKDKPQLLSASVLLLFSANLLYGLASLHRRIIFTVFHLTMFLFLLGRPLIGLIEGFSWWESSNGVFMQTLLLIYFTMVFLRLGSTAAEIYIAKKESSYKSPLPSKPVLNSAGIANLQNIMLAAFLVCMGCEALRDIERLRFMQNHTYYEYFASFRSALPEPVRILSNMQSYALCIFLSTLPSKRKAFVPLALYVLLTVPELIIGLRNPVVLNIIFVVLYYLLRDHLNGKKQIPEKWLGRFEKTAMVVAAPVLAVLMAMWNYIRDDISVQGMGFIQSIRDLLYKQGVSFNTVSAGIYSRPLLPSTNTSYVFGPFIEYFKRGALGRVLFGTKELLNNTVEMALYGNNFSNTISYLVRPDYLEGHGMGSSFIIEAYVDFGLIGVVLLAFIFGAAFIYMVKAFERGWLARTLVLIALTSLFFAPRAEALGWLTYLVSIQFWALVLAGCAAAGLLSKRLYQNYYQVGRIKDV